MEEKLVVRTGGSIIHEGVEFVVIDIRHHQNMNGKMLVIQALDPDTANKAQTDGMQMDQVKDDIMDLVKKLPDIFKRGM